MKKILLFLKSHWTFVFAVLIFIPLLLRNPYSTRTLIPNLEPFPDALYYTTPPRCFLHGQGWKMCRLHNREIDGISPAVPPAYSAIFIPGYMLNFDVRTFYFTNVFLAFISLVLLYLVSQNFFKNQYITGLILFFYTTNYFVYWSPTLAMAENLLNPIFLLSILLLQQQKLSFKTSALVGLVIASFYATKFAFAPLTVTFPIIFLYQVLRTKKTKKQKIAYLSTATLPAGIILASMVGATELLHVINQVLNGAIDTNSTDTITSGNSYFSMSYFSKHVIEYSNALLGKSQRFLWDTTPLTEKWIALPGILGLLINLKDKKNLPPKIWLITATISQLLFMSTFYVVDIRYVYHFLPILLLGFGFFLEHLQNSILRDKNYFKCFLFSVFIIYTIPNLMRLKSAVMVNLKYSETPWWYLSQLEMNTYFDSLEQATKKPILITLAAPFIMDNYSNQSYVSLPLNNQQDFKGSAQKVWGDNDYSDLLKLYQEKIKNGYNIYITNYGVSAAGHFQESYAIIEKSFKFSLVQSGCYNLCNIYKLETKE